MELFLYRMRDASMVPKILPGERFVRGYRRDGLSILLFAEHPDKSRFPDVLVDIVRLSQMEAKLYPVTRKIVDL